MQKEITINHFDEAITLPKEVQIAPYTRNYATSLKKKIKNKFDKFLYYRLGDQILKILFIDDDHYINQGRFPFKDPEGTIEEFKTLSAKSPQRLNIIEAAYIGHATNMEGKTQLIIKKMNGVKIQENSNEIQTVDDNFEMIPIGNEERFNQFRKILKLNKNAINMSIRVIIDESSQVQDPKVIDYEFFYRQAELKKNKIIKPQ